MKVRLTKTTVEAAKPGPKEYYIWDATQRGFGVRIRPSGSKVFVFRYGGGRRGLRRKLTLGTHGDITTEEARVSAHEARGAVAAGEDPARVRAAEKAVPTVKAFAQRYLEEHAVPHKRPLSVAEDRRLFKRVILPRLGSLRLDKVTTGDIKRLHHSRKGTPVDANRAVALLSHLFTFAEQEDLKPQGTNPCRGMKRYKEHKRTRFLAETELANLGKALAKSKESLFAVAAIRLLVLTGARRGEVLGAKWTDVDLGRGVLRVPMPKEGKPKEIRLGPPALKVLKSLPRIEGNPYMICGRKRGAGLVGLGHIWERIRAEAGLEELRLHDLRHSYASVAVSSGASLPIIGALLGHASPEMTQRYSHLSDDPLRATADATATRIASAMKGKRAG